MGMSLSCLAGGRYGAVDAIDCITTAPHGKWSRDTRRREKFNLESAIKIIEYKSKLIKEEKKLENDSNDDIDIAEQLIEYKKKDVWNVL